MRVKTRVEDLKVGMTAYLPFYGEFLRAKVLTVLPLPPRSAVTYRITSNSSLCQWVTQNDCVVETYMRPTTVVKGHCDS